LAGSFAYHTDDCKIFLQEGVGEVFELPEECKIKLKFIGCGITNNKFYITINQQLITIHKIKSTEGLFPCIGLDDAHIKCNFGQFPFSFRTISMKNCHSSIKHDIQHQRLIHKSTGQQSNQMAKCSNSLSQQFSYFEVTINGLGQGGVVTVGLTMQDIPLDKLPGWTTGSFGVHSDDGVFYNQEYITGKNQKIMSYAKEGDIIGCGLQKEKLFFTLNKKLQFEIPLPAECEDQPLYPSIGLDDAIVVYNFQTEWQ